MHKVSFSAKKKQQKTFETKNYNYIVFDIEINGCVDCGGRTQLLTQFIGLRGQSEKF